MKIGNKFTSLLLQTTDLGFPMPPELFIGLSLSGLLIMLRGAKPSQPANSDASNSATTIIYPSPIEGEIYIIKTTKK